MVPNTSVIVMVLYLQVVKKYIYRYIGISISRIEPVENAANMRNRTVHNDIGSRRRWTERPSIVERLYILFTLTVLTI